MNMQASYDLAAESKAGRPSSSKRPDQADTGEKAAAGWDRLRGLNQRTTYMMRRVCGSTSAGWPFT
jgi:hypothetical protein